MKNNKDSPEEGPDKQNTIHSEYDRLWAAVTDPSTKHRQRAHIGDQLDELGDADRRPGVGLTEVDLPDIAWLPVSGGKVTLEDNEASTFAVAPFYIAKYPLTYVQYRVFLESPDGFHNEAWWDELAASEQHKRGPTQQNRPTDNHPAETVSWYDGVAFCRWFTARVRSLPEEKLAGKADGEQHAIWNGIRSSKWVVRLPTEWEWQQAASGGDPANVYPWGPKWDSAKANTIESGLGRTTAVGMYPQGAAPCGALDMSGNVFEWCLNDYWTPARIELAGESYRVVRGGHWRADQGRARTAYRRRGYQPARNIFAGFRLAVAPPL